MRLLLDTHVLMWALSHPDRLPPAVRKAIGDPANSVVVSAVSAWEIALKQSIGKLDLPGRAEAWLPMAVEKSGFEWIDVTHEDALGVRALPWHHKDPFDRLLVAQTMGGYTLVTHDERIRSYGVPVLWQ